MGRQEKEGVKRKSKEKGSTQYRYKEASKWVWSRGTVTGDTSEEHGRAGGDG